MEGVKQAIIEEYEITPYTLLVMPTAYGSRIYSRIIELEGEYISPFKPIEIIKRSCEYFGSSYDGRKDGTKKLIGITHKAPIAIDPTSSIFFFPTTSPLRPQCIWIAYEHIEHHQRIDLSNTTITFRNKQSIDVPISDSSFENQLMRTSLLKNRLRQRIEETERKSFYMFSPRTLEASETNGKYSSGIHKKN
ncbi:competence protein ComK [Peribacillus sp. SCS-155]|uniref:competence protein ComK n=1 Tax=Peribacillus sedimenti TaxID=3115297 RepID=UPI003906D4DE